MIRAQRLMAVAAERLPRVLLDAGVTLGAALAQIERAGTGALLLADGERRLVGMVTDGDLRRALLAGTSMQAPCLTFATRTPLALPPGSSGRDALALMDHGRDYPVHALPVLNADGGIVGLVLRGDLMRTDDATDLQAVIMAGGYGTRLMPLTANTPKPMLPVGDRPLLELTIARLRAAGVRRVQVATHHLAEQIAEYFGDGSGFGVDISYLSESQPMGTAGALASVAATEGTLLVINGDVLTGLNFDEMLRFHRRERAELTVGLRAYSVDVPYGVVDCDGARVRGIREKPSHGVLVNAGVYLLEPSVCRAVPESRRCDMTDVIQLLLDAGRVVAGFPIVEYWLDIGRPGDYARAQDDVRLARL
jgi:dTDP-glucose pyrophosphorylase